MVRKVFITYTLNSIYKVTTYLSQTPRTTTLRITTLNKLTRCSKLLIIF